jgi:RNA polymerase sigma-70 factor, ECF subfamily
MGKVVALPQRKMISPSPVREQEYSPRTDDQRIDLPQLFYRVAAGEHQALAELYDATSKVVFSLALRIVHEREIAEDVVIEVYTQVWGHAATYDSQRGTPLAWLLTLTRSRAIDILRSRQRTQKEEPLEHAQHVSADLPSPEDHSEAAERQRVVRRALASLNEEQRQLIELAYFSDLSHSEIAARVGQPLGTVKTRIRLGMLRLREQLVPFAMQTPYVSAGKAL